MNLKPPGVLLCSATVFAAGSLSAVVQRLLKGGQGPTGELIATGGQPSLLLGRSRPLLGVALPPFLVQLSAVAPHMPIVIVYGIECAIF
jgi:hypothetical protein